MHIVICSFVYDIILSSLLDLLDISIVGGHMLFLSCYFIYSWEKCTLFITLLLPIKRNGWHLGLELG